MDKYDARKIKIELRKILLSDWDPIGIADVPQASDEYDGYLGTIFHLIDTGSTEKEIAKHLFDVEKNHLGFSRIKPLRVKSLRSVSKKLITTYQNLAVHDAN